MNDTGHASVLLLPSPEAYEAVPHESGVLPRFDEKPLIATVVGRAVITFANHHGFIPSSIQVLNLVT
jgi:hypothetical protein